MNGHCFLDPLKHKRLKVASEEIVGVDQSAPKAFCLHVSAI